MIYSDAIQIAQDLKARVAPGCEDARALIVGSVRRLKQYDIHDVEILCLPSRVPYVPKFGDRRIFSNHLEKILFSLEKEGVLNLIKGGEKMRQYWVKTSLYEIETLNGFKVEFYIVTPPAQWGVLSLIRTGPGSEEDNFSKWCVTRRSHGGILPEAYKVRHGGVWTMDQLDAHEEPRKGELPLPMPNEQDFFDFLGLEYIEPHFRHCPRGEKIK